MRGLLQRLAAEAARQVGEAYAPGSRGPVRTALRALAGFAEQCPERELFKERRHGEEGGFASAWNEWTFVLFSVWLSSRISRKTKKPVTADTIESYVSLLKGYLNYNYDFQLMERSPRLRGLLRAMKSKEPCGVRRCRRGMRRRHFKKLWEEAGTERGTTVREVNEHALLVVAWHVLARGGELAPSAKVWSAEEGPSRADVSFHSSSSGGRYALLWLRPLKKKGKRKAPKVPQFIAEFDGGGSDAYAALERLVKYDFVPLEERGGVPLFRKQAKGGAFVHMTVTDMRRCVRDRMRALGYANPRQWGAHSCRIGGATDLMATGQASQILLQAKGRWASDIGRIYARMTRRGQLAASRLMQRARGRDLEELLPGFIQPA